jgi:CheY-like chemotaxis protein
VATPPAKPKTSRSRTEDRIIQCLKIVVWPLLLLVVLMMFRDKIAPKDVSLNEKGIKISFYLLEAEKKGGPADKPAEHPLNPKEIQDVARRASELDLVSRTVLWVDDNPQNQEYERQALSALGIRFVLAKSTAEALPMLRSQKFDLVITDFKRQDDPQGGYTLLSEVMKVAPPPPLIIYTASATPELEAEARKRGAYAETNQPQRLFSLAVSALTSKK